MLFYFFCQGIQMTNINAILALEVMLKNISSTPNLHKLSFIFYLFIFYFPFKIIFLNVKYRNIKKKYVMLISH